MASDEELYRRVQAGDRTAFGDLYERHSSRLFSFLLGYVRQREEAEDLLHETFVRALRSAEVTFDRATFRTWLYRIGRNQALNRLRAKRRAEQATASWPAPKPAAAVDEQHEHMALRAALDTAVGQLPTPLAEVYQLRMRGLSYGEMADVLRIPLGTLKSRMHEMVVRLRAEMDLWSAE